MNDFGHIQLGLRGKLPPVPRGFGGKRHRSKNINAPLAHGMDVSGAASSASKMNRLVGTRARAASWVWVPGEGWVKWVDIERQVEKAHLDWRQKKAMQGIKVFDGHEARAAEIEAAVMRRGRSAA